MPFIENDAEPDLPALLSRTALNDVGRRAGTGHTVCRSDTPP